MLYQADQLDQLQLHLMKNLHTLENSEEAASEEHPSWDPYDINNVDRYPGLLSRAKIVESLRDLRDRGLAQPVRVRYAAYSEWRLTPEGRAIIIEMLPQLEAVPA